MKLFVLLGRYFVCHSYIFKKNSFEIPLILKCIKSVLRSAEAFLVSYIENQGCVIVVGVVGQCCQRMHVMMILIPTA